MAAKNTEKKTKVDINEEKKENSEIPTETTEETKEPTLDELKAKVTELEKLLHEKEDQHLRMAAEYENFRRRTREERERDQ